MNETQWYYTQRGERQGPMAQSQLAQLLASGQVSMGELVWREGMATWQPAPSVPELLPQGPQPPGGGPIGYYAPGPAYGYAQPPRPEDNAGIRMLIPVGRSGWAIAAGYLGLFSILIIPAPIAFAISIVAMNDIHKNPKRRGMGRAIFGLVMGLLFSLLGLVMFIARTH